MEAFLKEHSNKPDVGDYKFKFGKYRNKSFKEVYDTDKSYCAFLFRSLDKEKNKVLLDYIQGRVEQDYNSPQVEGQ
jgi:hypothetical protein